MPPVPRNLLLAVLSGALLSASALSAEKLRFNRDIRPLLSDRCFYCHGPDDKKREADLRLDTREGATADLGGYAAIVPGQPEKSELILRVISHDRDEVMPPLSAKKARFDEQEVALLKRWITEGAEYESHWAFMPLAAENPPDDRALAVRIDEWKGKQSDAAQRDTQAAFLQAWPKNGIDRFVLDRLLREGLTPSPEADAATLCRRLHLDLTGLLPTPAETDAFVKAAGRDLRAVEKFVDRLLESPHYGERWGRHWLDQARYADSNGYSIDGDRAMWPYRDWVIKALNDDLPFDQFTIEQLAGDLLPNPAKSQLIATGFHRNTLINQEGGSDPEQFRVEATVDRVNTTGAVWLGLTVGCAQCHTHKFDPITQREYFELFAFFNQAADRNNAGPTLAVKQGEVFGADSPKRDTPLSATDVAGWERTEQKRLDAIPAEGPAAKWVPATYLEFDTKSNAALNRLEDNSLLIDGRGAPNDSYRVVATTPLPKVAAVRLRVLPHESLPNGGVGTAGNGNFVLTEFTVRHQGKALKFTRVSADHEQPGYPARAAVDGASGTGWAVNSPRKELDTLRREHAAIFVLDKPLDVKGGQFEFRLNHELNQNYLIGRFALEFSATVPTRQPDETTLLAALRTAREKRTPDQRQAVENALVSEKRTVRSAQVMIMKDLPAGEGRETFLLTRGDFTRPDQAAGALHPGGIQAVAPALEAKPGRTRLDLARWLVAPDNPLTPRVTVNRIWMRYFGRGIVETEEDFGTQGSLPTHPELLDWLGREFIRAGWSMKKLHRLIVTSATYRQSSNARPDIAEKDPRNLLLARQERLRVEAEIIRDAALCASGLLEPQIGGPSVRPPQPDGVYAFTQTPKTWIADTGPNRYRRALYTVFYRSAPYPLLGTFDSPDFQTVCTRRARSNTPLQSLTLANDPAFLEIAQGLAVRLIREVPGEGDSVLDQRLRHAFLLCLSRPPSDTELAALSAYMRRQRDAFAQDPGSAAALAPPASLRRKEKVSEPEAAALVCAARVLFNTDNFITRE